MGRAFEFRKGRKMKRWSAMAKTFFELVIVSEVLEKQFMLTKNKRILAIKGNNLRVVFFKS
jgi:hypothetical protein